MTARFCGVLDIASRADLAVALAPLLVLLGVSRTRIDAPGDVGLGEPGADAPVFI